MKKVIFGLILLLGCIPTFAQDDEIGNMIHHSFDARIEYDSLALVEIILPNTQKYSFTLQGNFEYSASTGGILTDSGTTLDLTETLTGDTYIFSKEFRRLTSFIQANKTIWQLVYNQDNQLLYATDKLTQTYFFFYDSGNKLVRIETSSGDYRDFSYKNISGKYYLSEISSSQKKQYIEYDQQGNIISKEQKVDLQFQQGEKKGIIFDVYSQNIVRNKNTKVQYKKFSAKLYSLQDNRKIFLIDTQMKLRKLIFESSGIEDFYVGEDDIYFYKKSHIYRYNISSKKNFDVLNFPQIQEFFLSPDKGNIYFISALYPGYYVYNIFKKDLKIVDASKKYTALFMQAEKVETFKSEIGEDDLKQEEFLPKYVKSIEKLQEKWRGYSLTPRQKNQLVTLLEKNRETLIGKMNDSYKAAEIDFIFDRVKEEIQK